MKNIGIKLAAVVALALAPSAAMAGKGGSAEAIQAAVASRSVDAIIAELERAEGLLCSECVQIVTNLTEDARYEVREVAAWWFAKRPALRDALATQFVSDLPKGDSVRVRNAADFLGRTRTYTALADLRAASHRTDLGAEAKLALVRAATFMAHTGGNEVLLAGMSDADAGVRAAAVAGWREIIGQKNAQPVVALLGDRDASVRAHAATVIGAMREPGATAQLELLVVTDPDTSVRRNAAWALGKLGNASSRTALTAASHDKSGIVSGVAKASLASLH